VEQKNFEPQEAPEVEEVDYDDYYDDPEWEQPCPCWCEACGCHGWCLDEDEEELDTETE